MAPEPALVEPEPTELLPIDVEYAAVATLPLLPIEIDLSPEAEAFKPKAIHLVETA